MLAIRRFIIHAWLAATPLAILLALVAAFAVVAIASQIIAHIAGPQASDNLIADLATLFGMAVLFVPLAILTYAIIAITRWLLGRKHNLAARLRPRCPSR
jgi:uncharacterized membrane protein